MMSSNCFISTFAVHEGSKLSSQSSKTTCLGLLPSWTKPCKSELVTGISGLKTRRSHIPVSKNHALIPTSTPPRPSKHMGLWPAWQPADSRNEPWLRLTPGKRSTFSQSKENPHGFNQKVKRALQNLNSGLPALT